MTTSVEPEALAGAGGTVDRPMARSVSISIQISRVVIATAALAVLVTMCAMIAVAAMLAKSTLKQRADTIAELLAAGADVALALRDAERGREALSALSSSDTVTKARLLQADDVVLVTYVHKRPAAAGRAGALAVMFQ